MTSAETNEAKETVWLKQWLGLAIARGNTFRILTNLKYYYVINFKHAKDWLMTTGTSVYGAGNLYFPSRTACSHFQVEASVIIFLIKKKMSVGVKRGLLL